jgi:hypothetical protein
MSKSYNKNRYYVEIVSLNVYIKFYVDDKDYRFTPLEIYTNAGHYFRKDIADTGSMVIINRLTRKILKMDDCIHNKESFRVVSVKQYKKMQEFWGIY